MIITFWWLERISGEKKTFSSTNVSNNFVFSYGCINNFSQFWIYLYGTPPCRLQQRLVLGHIKEFMHDANVFNLLTLILTSLKTFNVLLTLYSPNIDFICSNSLLDFKAYSNLELHIKFMVSIFMHVSLVGYYSIWHEFLNIFETLLNVKISLITSFNFTNCAPMWSSITSLGPWFKFFWY